MDRELRLIMSVTRNLPRIRGVGRFCNIIKRFYLRKKRPVEEVDVLGLKMELDPAEFVDGLLLLAPQIYEFREVAFMNAHLQGGDVFLDAGAYIGIYSLLASRLVGPKGMVLAVEAEPYNYNRLEGNIKLNRLRNVRAVHVGLSSRKERLHMSINSQGNRGNSSFVSTGPGVEVDCLPLLDVLNVNGITKLDGAKFDLEGFEYRVLKKFFSDAPPTLYPGFVIVECFRRNVQKAGGNTVELLKGNGYKVFSSSRGCEYAMVRQ